MSHNKDGQQVRYVEVAAVPRQAMCLSSLAFLFCYIVLGLQHFLHCIIMVVYIGKLYYVHKGDFSKFVPSLFMSILYFNLESTLLLRKTCGCKNIKKRNRSEGTSFS